MKNEETNLTENGLSKKQPNNKRTCMECNEQMISSNKLQMFCNKHCRQIHYNKIRRKRNDDIYKKEQTTRTCKLCKKTFEMKSKSNWWKQEFCSKKCSNEYRHTTKIKQQRQKKLDSKRIQEHGYEKWKRICKWCGQEFETRHEIYNCCSIECSKMYHRNGKRISKIEYEKQKEKICLVCKKPFRTEDLNIKLCSEECKKQRKRDTIQKNRTEYRKRGAIKRLNLTEKQYEKLTTKCSLCGWKHNINIHHVKRKIDGGKDNIENYIAVCSNCHRLLHMNEYRDDINKVKKLIKDYKEETMRKVYG